MKQQIFLLLTLCCVASTACSGQPIDANAVKIPSAEPIAKAVQTPSPNAAPTTDDKSGSIWSGRSGDFEIVWSKKDIVANSVLTGKEVFSVAKNAKKRTHSAYGENFSKDGSANFETMTFAYSVISVVGPYVFLKESVSVGPPTSTSERFFAVDLADQGSRISLKNFFSEEEIVAALSQESEFASDFKARKLSPTTLEQMLASFNTNEKAATAGNEGFLADCWFPKDFLESFALNANDHGGLNAIIGIPCSSGMRDSEVRSFELSFDAKLLKPEIAALSATNVPKTTQETIVVIKPGH